MNKNKNEEPNIFLRPSFTWGIAALVVVLDQITKLFVTSVFPTTVIKNTGTTFGFFAQRNHLLLFFSSAIIAGLVAYLIKTRHVSTRSTLFVVACMLIIGGGVSNIIDRLVHNYVIDFIRVPLWPTFNVADISVSIGMTVLLWQTVIGKQVKNSRFRMSDNVPKDNGR